MRTRSDGRRRLERLDRLQVRHEPSSGLRKPGGPEFEAAEARIRARADLPRLRLRLLLHESARIEGHSVPDLPSEERARLGRCKELLRGHPRNQQDLDLEAIVRGYRRTYSTELATLLTDTECRLFEMLRKPREKDEEVALAWVDLSSEWPGLEGIDVPWVVSVARRAGLPFTHAGREHLNRVVHRLRFAPTPFDQVGLEASKLLSVVRIGWNDNHSGTR